MKKFFILLIANALLILAFAGCTVNNGGGSASSLIPSEPQNSNSLASSEPQNSNSLASSEPQNSNTKVEAWQDAYATFLKGLPPPPEGYMYSFTLHDFDSNGIPELMLIKQDLQAMDALLTVYSYDKKIYLIGEHTNPQKSFLGWFCFSDKPEYDGLFECWWGGGVSHYGYLSLENGALKFEYIFYEDRTKEPMEVVELSENKELINEASYGYSHNWYSDSVLDGGLINDVNIERIIFNAEF